jgi:TonB family protein
MRWPPPLNSRSLIEGPNLRIFVSARKVTETNNKNQIVQSEPQALAKQRSSLVRRGLRDLSTLPSYEPAPQQQQTEGGGDFASRYGWYIESVKRRIQGNWLQNTIDAGVRAARTAHAVVEFTIYKDGTVKDIRVSQSSGNPSMDNSGLRAVMSSNPMPSLPPDYSGSSVQVIFDFDLSMTT